ncbi:hypothetical protein IPH67_00445 [bacterium]|nr:MAG: hypothetical protein IPH67_00445 [bacterium]
MYLIFGATLTLTMVATDNNEISMIKVMLEGIQKTVIQKNDELTAKNNNLQALLHLKDKHIATTQEVLSKQDTQIFSLQNKLNPKGIARIRNYTWRGTKVGIIAGISIFLERKYNIVNMVTNFFNTNYSQSSSVSKDANDLSSSHQTNYKTDINDNNGRTI